MNMFIIAQASYYIFFHFICAETTSVRLSEKITALFYICVPEAQSTCFFQHEIRVFTVCFVRIPVAKQPTICAKCACPRFHEIMTFTETYNS